MQFLKPEIRADIHDAVGKGGITMGIYARQLGGDLVRHALGPVPHDGDRYVSIEADLGQHIGQRRFARDNIPRPPESVTGSDQVVYGQTVIPDTSGEKEAVELETDADPCHILIRDSS